MKGKYRTTGKRSRYDQAFMRRVVFELKTTDITFREVIEKYNINGTHQMVAKWVKKYGEDPDLEQKLDVADDQGKEAHATEREAELARELKLAKLKILGLETLIDEASKEMGVDIRKKSGSKQSKS